MTDDDKLKLAVSMKDRSLNLAEEVINFINEQCNESTVAFLAISLVLANMISGTEDHAKTREFMDGAVSAAMKDIALALNKSHTLQ